MSSTRKPLDRFVVTTMVLLCAIWGAQQVAIKLAAHDVVPIMQVGLRSAISAALVLLLMCCRGEKLSLRDGTLRPGLLAGALFAAEFLFVAEGLRRTSASHMAVLLYTSPIFTAIGLHWTVRGERLRRRQWLGILLAFAGIAVGVRRRLAPLGVTPPDAVAETLLGVLAGAAWGATTVVVRGRPCPTRRPRRRCSTSSPSRPSSSLGAAVGLRAGDAGLDHARRMDEPAVPGRRRVVRELPRVVLAAPPLRRVAGVGVLVPDAALRRDLRRARARRAVDVAFGLGAALVLAGITVVTGPSLRRRSVPAEAPVAMEGQG